MVELNNLLLLAKAKEVKLDKKKPQVPESGFFLFFSFDLSDSTVFKAEHPELWASVFSCFYSQILDRLGVGDYKSRYDECDDDSIGVRYLWKLIGDEVLIYIMINKLSQLYAQIVSVNKALGDMISKIAEEVSVKVFGVNQSNNGKKQEVKDIIESSLGIKVTAWLAECYINGNSNSSNIIYNPEMNAKNIKHMDFLGREIDEGFRIAKYAVKNKIIVSPLLAWLIWKDAQGDEDKKKLTDANFKITAFVSMKGVWRGRKVPIIMFHQEFSKFVDVLEYDELDLDTYANIKEFGYKEFIINERFKVERIDNILVNVHRKKEAEHIYIKLSESSDIKINILDDMRYKQELELHIACMIFNKEGKLLIHRDHERGYEFGCIKKVMVGDKASWKVYCEQEYDKKYGVKIKVNECPVPIATYLYDRKNALGIILMAEYDGKDDDIKEDWVLKSVEDIMKINDKMVDMFKENIKRAVQMRKLSECGN